MFELFGFAYLFWISISYMLCYLITCYLFYLYLICVLLVCIACVCTTERSLMLVSVGVMAVLDGMNWWCDCMMMMIFEWDHLSPLGRRSDVISLAPGEGMMYWYRVADGRTTGDGFAYDSESDSWKSQRVGKTCETWIRFSTPLWQLPIHGLART